MNVKHTQISFGNISFDLVVPETDTMMYMNYTGVKMTANSAVGDFIYEAPQPHAVSEVLPINDSVISPATCNIAYNIINKTQTITEDKKRYDITYFPNQQRAMTTYTFNGTEQEKKIYAGVEFEKNLSSNTTYSYIYAGNEPIAVYIQNDSNKLYYLHSVLNGDRKSVV